MTDPWDLARYLEEHPDDHEQRWRLAKKLYASWEYRHALEHLQILKNEWKPHINVNRYLAATLYRLGRYEEAAKELRGAIFEWPGEIALYEQLARVLEASGAKEEAAQVWDEVLEIDHNHATARSAAKRLREHEEEGAGKDLRIMDSDSGIQLESGMACPNCGAQNSNDFDICWQCHAPLSGDLKHHPTPLPASAEEKALLPREHLNLFAGFLTVGLFTIGVYLSLKLLSARADVARDAAVTYGSIYRHDLALSRVGTGLGVALLWPALLAIGVRAARPKHEVSGGWLLLMGVFLASACYLMTWLPGGMAWLALPAAALLSLAALLATMPKEKGRAAIAWVVQLALLLIITPLLFGFLEAKTLGTFHDPYGAVGPFFGLSADSGEDFELGTAVVQDAALPIEATVSWSADESAWLTHRAQRVVFIVDYAPTEAATPPVFEVLGPSGTQVFLDIELPGTRIPFDIVADTPYTLIMTGPPNVKASIYIESLLDFTTATLSE